MKKFLVSLALLLPLMALANEDFGINIPVWQDFAPTTFVDVKEPKGIGKFNVTAKYWYERRLAFEEGLATCKSLETYEERFTCYEELKVDQFKQNTEYNAKIEAQQNVNSAIPEMNNRMDMMIPVNGYLDSMTRFMPNELRGY